MNNVSPEEKENHNRNSKNNINNNTNTPSSFMMMTDGSGSGIRTGLQHVLMEPFQLNGCLLTNPTCTHILDLKDGVPLPSSRGEWEWIGG